MLSANPIIENAYMSLSTYLDDSITHAAYYCAIEAINSKAYYSSVMPSLAIR